MKLAAETETPSGLPAVVPHAAQYVKYLAPFYLDTAPVPEEHAHGGGGKALTSVATFLKALSFTAGRKALCAMLDSPDSKWDVKKLLPVPLQGFGNCLALWGSVNSEHKSLEATEHDWAFLVNKITLFETFATSVKEPIMNEPLFEQLKGSCQAYVDSYVTSCEKALTELGKGLVSELDLFKQKHEPVVSCAETWQMQSVSSFFDAENAGEMKSQIESVQETIVTLGGMCDAMKGILGHMSSNEEFKAFQEKAKKFHSEALQLIKETQKVAGTVVMCGVFLGTVEETAKKDVMGALKFCEKELALSQDDLPTKLRKLVTDAVGSSKKANRKRNSGEEGAEEPEVGKKRQKKDSKKKEPKDETEKKKRKAKS